MRVVGSQYRSNRGYYECNPKKASIDSQAGIFADDYLPGLSVCLFFKRYCLTSELSESMITHRKLT